MDVLIKVRKPYHAQLYAMTLASLPPVKSVVWVPALDFWVAVEQHAISPDEPALLSCVRVDELAEALLLASTQLPQVDGHLPLS